MSESSESRPDEDDPITYHHQREFEIRRLKMSGDDFQQLFEDIMVRARPGSGFVRVRSYGNVGDRKCDGLFRYDSTFFQVYSPDELKQAKVQKKINEDLDGAIEHWGDALRTWVFVYNVRRGVSSGILEILQEKQKQYPDIKVDHLSNDDLWEITRSLSIEQRNEILGLPPSSTAKTKQTPTSRINNQELETNWQDICQEILDRQIQFPTLNDLMAKDGVRIDPALFVPVGLVERKQKQYQRFDLGSAEQGSQLLQPVEEEIVKRFDDEEEFFSQVICNSDISNHSRLVITGEPGAGKTTLLQKIGDRLCQAGMFPIWFSLGKSGVLPTYEFLSRVLKENAQPRNFESSNWDASINALLQTGKVWLLLDGVDEFTTNGNPLHVIGAQLREAWANQVKVVLTCRLNAWDTYALPEFKVFRTLEFDCRTPVDGYQNQVEAYIYRFFTKDGVDPQLGNTLIQQLHLPGKERIRDSVKNPLRLSLLCYIWESGIGELPDTRAELYRIFVDYYYDLQELKHHEISIDRTERDTLNLALGEVAKAALDSHDSRFRLRKSLIETIPTMGKESAKDSLFDKAVRLGWLNRIGTTAEKPHEAAYAFFHTTFQEYFAALAIDDWDYFLPRKHESKPVDEKSYKVFDSQWEEVLSLWIGRKSVLSNKKDEFIRLLVNFRDNCESFYSYRAFFIAANLISEFKECFFREVIISKIIEFAFGSFQANLNQWVHYLVPISENSKAVLLKANAIISDSLNRFIKENKLSEEEAQQLLWSLLGRKNQFKLFTSFLDMFENDLLIDLNEPLQINALLNTLENTNNLIDLEDAIDKLGRIKFKNRQVVDRLIYILNKFRKSAHESLRERTIWYLGRIFKGEQEIITTLLSLLRTSKDDFTLLTLFSALVEIGRGNAVVINELELYLDDTKKKIDNMKVIEQGTLKPTDQLAYILKVQSIYGEYFEVSKCLLRIDPANSKATDILIGVLKISNNPTSYDEIATVFIEALSLSRNFCLMIKSLKELINQDIKQSNFQQFSSCFQILWHCAQNMNYLDFDRAWQSSPSANAELSTDD